jgi:hypothetical protein
MTLPPSSMNGDADDGPESGRPATVVVPFPVPDEERARRCKAEAERLARMSTVEWMYYVALPGYAEKFGVDGATLKGMVEAVIQENKKKAAEDRGELDRAEKKRDAAVRETERKAERKADRAERRDRERERAQERRDREAAKAAAKREREEEAKRVKRETAFAEIVELPKLTHEVRLKEAAKRLGEDLVFLTEEFEVYFAARTIPKDLEPWPTAVNTAELLAAVEAKFRRYVVASDAIVTASTLYSPFTYVVEIARHAPKLVYTFPERDAGKSTALHVVRWMAQRPYPAIEATGAVLYRIMDRLRPTLFLDEADSLFKRRRCWRTSSTRVGATPGPRSPAPDRTARSWNTVSTARR